VRKSHVAQQNRELLFYISHLVKVGADHVSFLKLRSSICENWSGCFRE